MWSVTAMQNAKWDALRECDDGAPPGGNVLAMTREGSDEKVPGRASERERGRTRPTKWQPFMHSLLLGFESSTQWENKVAIR